MKIRCSMPRWSGTLLSLAGGPPLFLKPAISVNQRVWMKSMGKLTANRKAPSELLTNMQRIGTKSPLMNWMEMNRQPETAPTERFRLNIPSLAQRILIIPIRGIFSFLRSHTRAIGASTVFVATLASLFVFKPNKFENMLKDNTEIHFDDVTIHPLSNSGRDASRRSESHTIYSSNSSGRHSSVSDTEKEMTIAPLQADTFGIQNTSDDKHGAWLTGTIEFTETFQSRSLPRGDRIGQRIEYFSQNRD